MIYPTVRLRQPTSAALLIIVSIMSAGCEVLQTRDETTIGLAAPNEGPSDPLPAYVAWPAYAGGAQPAFPAPQTSSTSASVDVAPAMAPYVGTALGTPNGEYERDLLTRIEHELALVERMAAQASAVADESRAVQFRYDWLVRDLGMARQGIRAHLQDPGVQPRQFEPLRGDYRR